MKIIALTGANSYLGRVAIQFLREKTTHQILALVSPRAGLPAEKDERVRYLRTDLTQPLPAEAAAELAKADRLFHFAWTRTGSAEEVSRANRGMIEHLLGAMPDASKFWFVSSVSASPKPMSTYGATKHEATELVRARGGSVLVCGLVVEPDPPRGPYKMLRKNVGRFPFRIRVTSGEPLVFPLRLEDLGATLAHVSNTDLPPGIYRMFSPPVGFNAFLALLEELAPKGRVPVPLPAGLILKSAALAKKSRVVPVKLCDQILTFLYKDADHLLSHNEIPGLAWTPCKDTSFFK
jgi:nucleoside-diphosphate-sugar epimerase